MLAACALEAPISAEDAPTLEAPLAASHPLVLLPTAPGVARECAAELGSTYCTAVEATAAAARCSRRLDSATRSACTGAGCTVTYAAERATCHAGKTYPTAASCDQPVPDDCAFYRSCLEAKHPCGDEGYALQYGERLCYAFVEKREGFSAEGQTWLRGIRACLQRALVPVLHEAASCTAVIDKAYATHPDCYTAPDNSFCALPVSDVLELASILGKDLLSTRALTQMRQVAHTCALRFLGFDTASRANPSRHKLFLELEEASVSDASLSAFVAQKRLTAGEGVAE
jgi:hypothetical protein